MPNIGDTPVFTGPEWTATTPAGDVTGSPGASTVIKIQHNPVAAQLLNSITDGYVLTWDNTDGYWKAEPSTGGGGGSFTAGNDLAGTSSSQTVISAQSGAISFTGGTTPVIQSNSSATALTIGTNMSGAVLNLQGDATTTIFSLNGVAANLIGGAYLGLQGLSATYPTSGAIRSTDHAGTGTNILGIEHGGSSYVALSQLGSALNIGADYNLANAVGTIYLNATGVIDCVLGGSSYQYLNTTNLYLGVYAGAGTSLIFDWSTSTTPIIQSGTSATALTIGTNKTGAVLNLQSDAAHNAMILSETSSTISNIALVSPDGVTQTNISTLTSGFTQILGVSSNAISIGSSASYIEVSGALAQIEGTTILIEDYSGAYPLTFTPAAAYTIQAGAAITSLTIGTSKNAATLNLDGGNGVLALSISASGSTAGTGNISITGSIQQTVNKSTSNYTIDSSTTDKIIRITATQTVTLPPPTTGRSLEIWVDGYAAGADVVFTLAPNASEQINGFATNFVITVSKNQICRFTVESVDDSTHGTNWWIGSG